MLVVERNVSQYYWKLGDPAKPLAYKGELIIVFDPSKSNMAVLIGTPSGQVIDNLEFSGNNRKRGPAMDTSLYCQEVRAYLKQYLEGCQIYMAATEATIEKKGVSYYQSNLVLTEIRANILNFFREYFHMECLEINNWTWKHCILPDGYRGQKEKGSKRFLGDAFPELGYHLYFEADTCDVVCMYLYIIRKMCQSYTLLCNRSESCDIPYKYVYCPTDTSKQGLGTETVFNNKFSLMDNISYYVNRIMTRFYMDVPVSCVPIEDAYVHAGKFQFSNINDNSVRVVVARCSF